MTTFTINVNIDAAVRVPHIELACWAKNSTSDTSFQLATRGQQAQLPGLLRLAGFLYMRTCGISIIPSSKLEPQCAVGWLELGAWSGLWSEPVPKSEALASLAYVYNITPEYINMDILRSFFWARSVGTSLASHKLPPEHRLLLFLAEHFLIFFAFSTSFVLLPFSQFFRFFVSSFLLFRLCLYVKPAANN